MSWIKRLIPSFIKQKYWDFLTKKSIRKREQKKQQEKQNEIQFRRDTIQQMNQESAQNPTLERILNSNYENGFLRLRITNRCNCRCKFCFYTKMEGAYDMPYDWYMEKLKPLYKNLRTICLSGGEAFVNSHCFEYCEMMAREFPAVNIYLESNVIIFDEKWQKYAMENLCPIHFSTNATSLENYQKNVWDGEHGKAAFLSSQTNLKHYMELLKQNHLEIFAPVISMVVNKYTACEVREFVKQSLELQVQQAAFFIDSSESLEVSSETLEAIEQLFEMERVLQGKYFLSFRIYLPKTQTCVQDVEKKVAERSIEELRERYSDLLDLAKDRNIMREWKQRQEIRRNRGKRTYDTLEEDLHTHCHRMIIDENRVCMSPWNELDIYPTGKFRLCGWDAVAGQLQDYMDENQNIDWDRFLHSDALRLVRYMHWKHDYRFCMLNCPLNPSCEKINLGINIEQ